MTTVAIIMVAAFIFYVAYMIGESKGYERGEQDGRLDQHWYQERIKQKTKRR